MQKNKKDTRVGTSSERMTTSDKGAAAAVVGKYHHFEFALDEIQQDGGTIVWSAAELLPAIRNLERHGGDGLLGVEESRAYVNEFLSACQVAARRIKGANCGRLSAYCDGGPGYSEEQLLMTSVRAYLDPNGDLVFVVGMDKMRLDREVEWPHVSISWREQVSVEQVEILRGPKSVYYGPGAQMDWRDAPACCYMVLWSNG